MILKHINEPILFQGRKKIRKYFEGWYFKQVSSDLKNSICIIPGIAKDTSDTHAFIQTIIYAYTDSKAVLYNIRPESFVQGTTCTVVICFPPV